MARLADVAPGQLIASAWHNTNRDNTATPFASVAEAKADSISRRGLVKITVPFTGYVPIVRQDAGDYGGAGWRIAYDYTFNLTVPAAGNGAVSLSAAAAGVTTFLSISAGISYAAGLGAGPQWIGGPKAAFPGAGPVFFRAWGVSATNVPTWVADATAISLTAHVVGIL
jgi:hypothetical protein